MHITSSSYWWLSLLHSQGASKHVIKKAITYMVASVFETRHYVHSSASVGAAIIFINAASAPCGIQTNNATSVNARIK